MANGGWDEAVATALKDEQVRVTTLERQLGAANQQKPQHVLPSDDVIKAQLLDLMRLVTVDPIRGREALVRWLRPFVQRLPKLSAATSKRVCLISFLRLPTAN